MIPEAQVETAEDKTVISGLCWYTCDWYGLLITVGCVIGVGGDFSQTGLWFSQVAETIGLPVRHQYIRPPKWRVSYAGAVTPELQL